MSTRVFFLNSATTQYGEEELNSIQKFLFSQGVLNTVGSSWEDWIANGDLKVSQRGAGANMSVDVKAGWALLNTTRTAITFKVFSQSIGVTNLAVANNVSGANRIDAVIMRVSRSVTPNLLANNVVTLQLLTGTSATALTDGAITTAIGSDDFIRLANITVANGAVSILSASCVDTRVRASTNSTFKHAPEVVEFLALSADPIGANLTEGLVWYNITTHTLNFYNGTITKQLGATSSFLSNDDTTVNGVDQTQTIQNASRAFGEADATTRNNQLSQSYIADRTSVIGVELYKTVDTGTFTGTVTVSLFADLSGSPTGSALATVTLSNASWLSLGIGKFTATFGSPYVATLGSTYHIVITSSTADNTNHPNLGTNSAGGYSSGSVKFKNTTDGWTAVATIDLYFQTLQTTVLKVVKTNNLGKIDNLLLNTKFGGDGSDGVLNVISGTTTIDLGGLASKIFNYVSINVSAGATLTFTNALASGTLISLKSQGGISIQGTINGKGFGCASNNSPSAFLVFGTGAGGGGAGSLGGAGGGGGSAMTTPGAYTLSQLKIDTKSPVYIIPGAGGGSGSNSSGGGVGGAGGTGGSALYIECGGAWNFTGTIDISGNNGVSGTGNMGGGGGGGAPGTMLALYNSLTASSGTVINIGGNGGNANGTGGATPGSGGGGAGSLLGAGGAGGNSVNGTASALAGGGGAGGTSSATTGGTGGTTNSGTYFITKNTSYF